MAIHEREEQNVLKCSKCRGSRFYSQTVYAGLNKNRVEKMEFFLPDVFAAYSDKKETLIKCESCNEVVKKI